MHMLIMLPNEKRLYRHRLSEIRVYLEAQEDEAMSPFIYSFSYYIVMIGMDDKASIPVSYPETPVAATLYNNVQTVVPAGTKIHAADHDSSGIAKIVPSISVDMNIGQDPSESY